MTLSVHISYECRCEFHSPKCNLWHKWNNIKCQCECKKLIKHRAFEEGYIWNPSTCACECDRENEIGEYLKGRKCMKSVLIDDLVVTCDGTEITPESAAINSCNGRSYWVIAAVVLAIACLPLLLVSAVKY